MNDTPLAWKGIRMNFFSPRRRVLAALAFVAAVLCMGGCAVLNPGPKTVQISEARLAELMARQFPFNSRYLEIFDVVIGTPRVALLPESNRIGTQFNYSLGSALLGARQFAGTLDLSYGLRFEPGDGTLRLADVRVEGVRVPGVPLAFQNQANRLGGLLAENLLRDQVIHRLSEQDLASAKGWGYQPGAFKVVPGAVQLQLDPIAR
jgi:hypothetical protein